MATPTEHATLLTYGSAVVQSFERAAALEWLETNGLGDFACGTVAGVNTRRAHGLFIAGTPRPMLLLAAMDAWIEHDGARIPLSTHQFADTVHPEGYRLCTQFTLDPFPEWRFEFPGGALTRRTFMPHDRRCVVTSWELDTAGSAGTEPVEVRLKLRPLFAYRDLDTLTHANLDADLALQPAREGFALAPYAGCPEMFVRCPGAAVRFDPVWYYRFRHDEDIALGRPSTGSAGSPQAGSGPGEAEEDFFTPCELTYDLTPGRTAWLVAGTESVCEDPVLLESDERARCKALTLRGLEADPISCTLARAADAFCVSAVPRVARTIPSTGSVPRAESSGKSASPAAGGGEKAVETHDDRGLDNPRHIACSQQRQPEEEGAEIICGYPEFSRDLRAGLIAMPGLLLATRRLDEAKSYLTAALAELRSRPALGDEALWFIRAAEMYMDYSRDWEYLRAELAPGCLAVTERLATEKPESGLRLDADGLLLCAGGAPLTWMDAVVRGVPVTPRAGKAVEVNALWHCALGLMARWAGRLGQEEQARRWLAVRELCGRSFRMRFWNPSRGCLFDVVDTPAGNDPAIRPNQLLAVALGGDLLERSQASAVMDLVEKRLLAPGGLRTLSLEEPAFRPDGEGDADARAAARHQGSVHPWLLGFYTDALFRVHGRTPRAHARAETALEWLTQEHLAQGCIGQVGEMFDGAAPHAPRGAIAHAPAVGELIRAWTEIRGRAW